jgi:hypothetical protein
MMHSSFIQTANFQNSEFSAFSQIQMILRVLYKASLELFEHYDHV